MQGLIDLSLAPHMIQIMDDLSPQSPVKVVYLCSGTQLSKSTLNLILIAYRIDCRIRGPILAMHAVKEMAVAWAKDELAETIIANDYIHRVLQDVKKGDDAYLFKKWPGGSLITRGGATGTAFAKISASLLLIDDLDRFGMNVGATTSGKFEQRKIGEGSPLKLLFDRVSGRFGDYKIFANSSPRAEGESIIWPALQTTDQNHFYVACPKCGLFQTWEFDNLVIPHENYTLTEEPYIECQNTDCKHRIYERHKYKVLQNWEWRPHGEGIDPLIKGYRISSIYSMLGYPLKQYAQDWLTACKVFDETGDEGEKIRHRNSKQAMPWKKKVGRTINHSALYRTMENLDPLPENCVILSCGFDVQENPGRIEGQVNGFGPNHERYIIDHQIFGGDPKIKPGLEGSPWNAVSDFIQTKRYLNCYGIEQPIYCAAIDISYGKDDAWVKYFLQNIQTLYFQHVFGVFGREVTKASINFLPANSTRDVDGFETWGIFSNIKKVALYNLFERHLREPERSTLHFGDKPCFTEQWFRQLTIERPNEKGILEKPHDHARNEALDCCYIAEAAFLLAFREYEQGPDWDDFKQWNKSKPTADSSAGVRVVGSVF